MKQSKIIRRHLWLWGLIGFGFLLFIVAYWLNILVALVGLTLSIVSLLLAMNKSIAVQNEAKYLYLKSFGDEAGRVQLKRIFYLARSAFLVFGIVLLAGTLFLWAMVPQEFVEIRGKIAAVERQEDRLKIQLDGDPHRYGMDAASISGEDLDSILSNLRPGDPITLLIATGGEVAPDHADIIVYSLSTDQHEYANTPFPGDAFARVIKDSRLLGGLVSILGGIYLFAGDIRQRMRVC